MFLSTLLIDVGDNPDRPRPGRKWLQNVYRVHQRLCMAFPSRARAGRDPHLLQPFAPDDFAQRHVKVSRTPEAGFLFRVDPLAGSSAAVIVLSAGRPDWNYAFGLTPGLTDPATGSPVGAAGHLLAAPPPEPRPFEPTLAAGQTFRFRLLANATKKVQTLSKQERQAKAPKCHGRRVPVRPDDTLPWLQRRAARCGFRLLDHTEIVAGWVYVNKTRDPAGGQRLRSVRFDGLLEVVDVEAFAAALAGGVGPAKGYGFGLLSIAPA